MSDARPRRARRPRSRLRGLRRRPPRPAAAHRRAAARAVAPASPPARARSARPADARRPRPSSRTARRPAGRELARRVADRCCARRWTGSRRLLQDAPLDAPGIPELVGVYALPADGPALLREARAGAAREEPGTPLGRAPRRARPRCSPRSTRPRCIELEQEPRLGRHGAVRPPPAVCRARPQRHAARVGRPFPFDPRADRRPSRPAATRTGRPLAVPPADPRSGPAHARRSCAIRTSCAAPGRSASTLNVRKPAQPGVPAFRRRAAAGAARPGCHRSLAGGRPRPTRRLRLRPQLRPRPVLPRRARARSRPRCCRSSTCPRSNWISSAWLVRRAGPDAGAMPDPGRCALDTGRCRGASCRSDWGRQGRHRALSAARAASALQAVELPGWWS